MKRYTVFLNWKNQPCYNDILHRVIHRLSSTRQSIMAFFMIEQIVLKFVLKNKIIQIAKNNPGEEITELEVYILPDLRIYHKLKSSRQYGTGTKTDV